MLLVICVIVIVIVVDTCCSLAVTLVSPVLALMYKNI